MNSIKKFILCLLAVFMALLSGNVYAENESCYNTDIIENTENTVNEKSGELLFEKCAENENYILLADYSTGILALENKSTGYIWYSSPPDAESDVTASPLIKDELLSSNILRYGIPEKRSDNNVLRSGTDECDITVSNIKNGIEVIYDYKKAGFKFPVEYTLETDYLKASLKVSEIEETNPKNFATQITIMNSFGAGPADEDGYFIVPDGCGALIRFNNNKTSADVYSQYVYGSDVTAVPAVKKNNTSQQIYLPVYSIVKQDNAMLVVAEKGDSNAYISAEVSGQSGSSYNLCSFTFVLRSSDTFYMSGESNKKFTVFENGDINSDDIELRYYPVSKKNADYTDVAECYRNYLINNQGLVKKTTENQAPLYINFYGGVQKKKSVFGIPVTVKQSVTSFGQAYEILTELKEKGADNLVVSYKNWTDDGIENKIDTGAEPSGTLGGENTFNKLKNFINENNYKFYPAVDNMEFYSGNGYNSFGDTCVRVSGAYSRIVSYDMAYGIPDGFSKNSSLLSPDYFTDVFTETAADYKNSGLYGISAGTLTTSLYGDYGKKNISRFKAMGLIKESLKTLQDSGNSILADNSNAYSLPYVNDIINIPLDSSKFDLSDEDIPFLQIVLHGIIPYSATAVNASANPDDTLLKAVSSGSLLNYDLIYEETSLLKDTEYDIYYYAGYSGWLDDMVLKYKLLSPVFENIAESTITGYETDGGKIITSYSNGTVIIVDSENYTVDFNGEIINIRE